MSLSTLLMLHPQHKLVYFKTAGWEDEWISAAEHIVRNKFERSYADHGHTTNDLDNEGSGDKSLDEKVYYHYIFLHCQIIYLLLIP